MRKLSPQRLFLILSLCCLCAVQAYAQVGSWTPLVRTAPHDNNGVMVLLSDGSVICHTTSGGTGGNGTIWDKLTPDSTGSYVNGTWTSIAGMTQERYSFSSEMLKDGRVYAAGGEYGTDGTQNGWHVEIYDPVLNTWTEATGTNSTNVISDGNCKILENGKVLQALVDVSFPVHTVVYNPATNAMATGPSTQHGQNESMWLKLPDNSILFVNEGAQTSERYIPATNTWIADGAVPVALYDAFGLECGPGWMLPDGRAFFIGGTNHTAYYQPSGTTAPGTWTAGPDVPNGYGMPDAPGAMMMNGKILFASSPQPTAATEFATPTKFYEFDYLTNTYTAVAAPSTAATNAISQQYNMLDLPNGQVLLGMDQDNTSSQYYVYSPTGTALAAGKPSISQLTRLTCSTYMITGHLFNGIGEGAAFGDENENDSNYPLFRFKTGNKVSYARSYNWNSTGVQRGNKPDTAYFTIPATMVPGASYYLSAVANGIASDSILFVDSVASLSSALTNSVCTGSAFTYVPTSSTSGATFTWTRPAVTGISNAAITVAQTINPNEILINTTSAPITVTYVYNITGGGCTNTQNMTVTVNPHPTAGFTASPLSSCSLPDSVTFTNTTVAGTSYVWTFGDGGTSTATAPVHAYTSSSSFTVKLKATSACGVDSLTRSNYVAVTAPAGPTAPNVSHCGASSSFTLTANTSNHVGWFDSLGVFLSGANPYITPVLTTSKTYYVQDTVTSPIDSVGPAAYTTLGAGGIFTGTNQHYLTFDALSNFTLISVVVDASTVGTRTIQLLSSTGAVLATATPNIPIGVSTVPLNFNVPTGTGYELAISGTVNLYRNNAVTSGYPFTVAGLVSITGNDVGTGYYYYFYDWKVQGPACVSARTPVNAILGGASFTLTPTSTPVACHGDSTGSASVTVNGGTPTYIYAWSNGKTTSSISNAPAGAYTVTVTDASTCAATAAVTIAQPAAALSTSAATTNVLCFGGATGTITPTTTGGTTNYTYDWGGGITTPNRINLTQGTYVVTVTDAHNCTTTHSSTITQPAAALSATATTTNVLCFGGATGTITTTTTGGTTNYTYDWGGGITTPNRINLTQGTYVVTVTDAHNCTTTHSSTITQPAAALSASATSTNVLCFGGATGTITTTTTGGTTNYTYDWGGGITTPNRINLTQGTYVVTVTDAHNCTTTHSTTITQPASGLSVSAATTNVLCFGGATGTITTTTTGGTTNYTYDWGGGITTPNRINLTQGTYVVTVTDAHNCTTTHSSTITQPGAALSASATSTNVLCFGAATGSITLTTTGGTTTYTYDWGGGITTQNRINLTQGTYVVTVTDAHNCTTTHSTTITQPAAALSASTVVGNVSCFGGSNGSINLTVSGGTTNYTYNWGGGIVLQNRINLTQGTYVVTVTDAHNCTTVKSSTVTQPTAITVQATSTPASCGQSNGTATASASGGTGTLTYLWSTGQTIPSISNLSSGNITVTVTDAHNCTASQGVNVTSPAAFNLSNAITAVSCHGGANGTATITPSIGTGSYTYVWPGGLSGATQSTLTAGTYIVNVTDGNSCSKVDTVIVAQPAAITDVLTGTSPLCHGAATGSIGLQAQGGTGTLTYQWSPPLSNLNNLVAGTYLLTVTDAHNCIHKDTVTLSQPAAITAQSVSTNVLCHGDSTGTATVTPAGGAGVYTYLWSNGATTATLTNVKAGTYILTVTDANSCASTDTVHVSEPSSVQALTSSTTAHNGNNDGTASVTPSGGTPTYTYTWNTVPVQTTATAINLPSGTYVVTVSDANGCTVTAQTTVNINTAVSEVADIKLLNIYPNPASSSLTIQAELGKATDITIEVRDMLGRLVHTTSYANEKEIHASLDVSTWPAAVYTVQVKTANGIVTKEITIER